MRSDCQQKCFIQRRNVKKVATKLKDVNLEYLPLYSFKEDLTKGMRLYNKLLPLFDGLVEEPYDDLKGDFENRRSLFCADAHYG